MIKVILVRHGKTLWNSSGRFQGQANTELSPEGIMQAQKLAENFPVEHIDAVLQQSFRPRFYHRKNYC